MLTLRLSGLFVPLQCMLWPVVLLRVERVALSAYCDASTDYETLLKSYSKAHQVIEQEGVPNFFIRGLVELEGFIEEKLKDKESFKKLSRPKALALNTLRAKVRKTTEPWAASISECKENPEKFETQSEESDEADVSRIVGR